MLDNEKNSKIYILSSAFFINVLILSSMLWYGTERNPPPASRVSASVVYSRVQKAPEPEFELPQFPEISAHAYGVWIVGRESPLVAQREWKSVAPASLTKLMTALVAEERLVSDDKIIISYEARNVEPKVSPLPAGVVISKDEAMALALVASYNDAALALAERIGENFGGTDFDAKMDIFAGLMREKAGAIGLTDSFFKNPTGLDEDGHKMSARDLYRLAEYIWKNHRKLFDISRTLSYPVYLDDTVLDTAVNTDELLAEFPGVLGSKTGFTDNAKGALLFLYPVKPDFISVVVILGSEDRFGDGRKIIHWLEDLVTR